jgi:hypothetical protein
VPHGQRDGYLRPYSRMSTPEPLLFFQVAPQLYSQVWVDHFQTHCSSEHMVAPGIEPGPLDLKPGALTTRPQRHAVMLLNITSRLRLIGVTKNKAVQGNVVLITICSFNLKPLSVSGKLTKRKLNYFILCSAATAVTDVSSMDGKTSSGSWPLLPSDQFLNIQNF